jgi:predicted metalloprotease with PDZ domain
MFVTADTGLEDLTRVLAHEQMHSWIDDEIGGRAPDEEGLEYWLSEGFSDFYALRSLLGSGLFTPEAFVEELNAALLRYGTSRVQTASNSRIAAEFSSDRDLQQLPYDRGHLFAILLDAEVKRASGGRADLDDVMRAQLTAARTRAPSDKTSAGRLLPVTVRRVAGVDVTPLLDRHIARGEPIVLPGDLFGDCAGWRRALATRSSFR